MKTFWIILFCTVLPLASSAQERISGHTCNAQTGEILPYATVVVKGRSAGTISDRDGLFELTASPADTILFSHVGFRSAVRTFAELAEGGQKVFLEPGEYEIEEIVVTNRKTREVKLGHSSGGVRTFAAPFFMSHEITKGDRVGKELGTVINIKHDTRILSLGMLISFNKYESAKFRVSFYAMDGETPGELVVNENITFELKDGARDWFELDLTPYNIWLDGGQEVLVTLTLLDEKGAEGPNMFSVNAALMSGKGIFKRDVGDREWERIGGTMTLFLNGRIYL